MKDSVGKFKKWGIPFHKKAFLGQSGEVSTHFVRDHYWP